MQVKKDFLMLKMLLSRKVLVLTTQKFLLASMSIQKSKILSVIGRSTFTYEPPRILVSGEWKGIGQILRLGQNILYFTSNSERNLI